MVIKVYIEDVGKSLKLEITNPKPASVKKLSDMDFGLNIIKEWKIHTAFLLRENMEILNP